MAIEPKNIIQVQSELQNPSVVTNEKLMEYANGSNPEVPSFLALIEMNRRKEISNSSNAFNQSNKDSIKNQIASTLTHPQSGVNMGANPFTKDMTAAAPGVNMAGNPATTDMTKGIAGVNPAAAPVQTSVAPIQPITGAEGGLMSIPVGHFNEQSYAGGGIIAFSGQTDGSVVPKPDPQFQGIVASLPKVEAPVEKTQEQLWADKQARDRLAGVAADPYADVKARELKREERQQAMYDKQGMDRLMAQLTAFGAADPAGGFGVAAGASAKASKDLEKEQNILRDKEEAAQIEFQRGIAKEEDARKRGDSDGIKAALDAQQKAKFDFAKAQHDTGMLAAQIYNVQENANYHNKMAGKPTREEFLANLAKTDPDTFRLIQGQGKAGELTFEEAYKAANDPKRDPSVLGMTEDQRVRRAQDLLDAQTRLRKTGDSTNPNAPAAAATTESNWQPPDWLRSVIGGPAPKTVSFDQLPSK